jgi:hypothetical protein
MGPKGLFIYSAVIAVALAAFIVVRIRLLPRPAAKGGFVDVTPTSSATALLDPRVERGAAIYDPASCEDKQPEQAGSGEPDPAAHKSTPATATAETFS